MIDPDLMLAVLVRDLGYTADDPPIYGHHPLRHQFAWRKAVEGLTESDIQAKVQNILRGMNAEGEVPGEHVRRHG